MPGNGFFLSVPARSAKENKKHTLFISPCPRFHFAAIITSKGELHFQQGDGCACVSLFSG